MVEKISRFAGFVFAALVITVTLTVDRRAQCMIDSEGTTAVRFSNQSKYDVTFFIDGEEKCELQPNVVSGEWVVEPGEHRLAARAIILGIPFLMIVTNDVPRGRVCTWMVDDEEVAKGTGSMSTERCGEDRAAAIPSL